MACEVARFIAISGLLNGEGLHRELLSHWLKLGHQVGLLVVQFHVKGLVGLLQVLVQVLVRVIMLVEVLVLGIVHFVITIGVLHFSLTNCFLLLLTKIN